MRSYIVVWGKHWVIIFFLSYSVHHHHHHVQDVHMARLNIDHNHSSLVLSIYFLLNSSLVSVLTQQLLLLKVLVTTISCSPSRSPLSWWWLLSRHLPLPSSESESFIPSIIIIREIWSTMVNRKPIRNRRCVTIFLPPKPLIIIIGSLKSWDGTMVHQNAASKGFYSISHYKNVSSKYATSLCVPKSKSATFARNVQPVWNTCVSHRIMRSIQGLCARSNRSLLPAQ